MNSYEYEEYTENPGNQQNTEGFQFTDGKLTPPFQYNEMNQPQQNMFDDMNNVVEVDEPVNKEKESVSKPGNYHITFVISAI